MKDGFVSVACGTPPLRLADCDYNAEQTFTMMRSAEQAGAKVLVLPELAGDDTAWYLLDTSKPIKPFIVQERRAADFTALDKPDDQNVFLRNQYLYGTSWRGNAGYALWQLAYMSDGTVA